MTNLNLESFVNVYVESALELVSKNSSVSLDDFYVYVCDKVSERTGFSKEEVKYLHHAFHWVFFLRENPSFEMVDTKEKGTGYQVRFRNGIPEKSELVARVLKEHEKWLRIRLQKLGKI